MTTYDLSETVSEALRLIEEYSCKTQVGHIADECETVAKRLRAALADLRKTVNT